MKPKFVELNGARYIEVLDDKPLYLADDGKEVPFDAVSAIGKISALNAEARDHRIAKETALAKLKSFDGLEDAEAARKALDTLKNIDEGKLLSAGKVEEIKSQAQRAAEDKVAAFTKNFKEENDSLRGNLDAVTKAWHGEKLAVAFASSKFINEKVVVPPEMMQATFGSAFKVEGGKLIAHDPAGNVIGSQVKFGEPAGFDEAIEKLVQSSAFRDNILKGTGNAGSGSRPGADKGGGKVMSSDVFSKLPAKDRSAFMADGGKLVD